MFIARDSMSRDGSITWFDFSCIDASLKEKTKALQLMSIHLQNMSAHDALTLLRYSFAIPGLKYLLHISPISSHRVKYLGQHLTGNVGGSHEHHTQ